MHFSVNCFSMRKGKSDDYYIDGFIQYLYKLTMIYNLTNFKKYGLEEKDIELIMQKHGN